MSVLVRGLAGNRWQIQSLTKESLKGVTIDIGVGRVKGIDKGCWNKHGWEKERVSMPGLKEQGKCGIIRMSWELEPWKESCLEEAVAIDKSSHLRDHSQIGAWQYLAFSFFLYYLLLELPTAKPDEKPVARESRWHSLKGSVLGCLDDSVS